MNRYSGPVTPAEISSELAALCNDLVPNGTPSYVPVHPKLDAPSNECFPLVDAVVSKKGGSCLLGWSLWEFPGVFVEAEFHAVSASPSGNPVDVTPKGRPVEQILFLPDRNATYSGRQVNNVRRTLTADPCVARYLATFDAEFALLNRGARADQHGQIELSDAEADEYTNIQAERVSLHSRVLQLAAAIGPYTPCPCNSGKKVKWCHGSHHGG